MVDAPTIAIIASILFGSGGWVSAIASWRKTRIDESTALSRISKEIRDEIREENKEMRDRMDKVVQAVLSLTNMLDDLFPKITGLSTDELIQLRLRLNHLKRIT